MYITKCRRTSIKNGSESAEGNLLSKLKVTTPSAPSIFQVCVCLFVCFFCFVLFCFCLFTCLLCFVCFVMFCSVFFFICFFYLRLLFVLCLFLSVCLFLCWCVCLFVFDKAALFSCIFEYIHSFIQNLFPHHIITYNK